RPRADRESGSGTAPPATAAAPAPPWRRGPAGSPLERARRQSPDQMALQDGEEHGHGQRADDDAGGELTPLDLVLTDHEQEPGRERAHLRLRRERDGEEQLAPRRHEGEDGGG